jgi:sensor histidine kinase YesM
LCRTDPKLAEEAVLEFSDYLRGNLDALSIKGSISFERELRHLETYLSIEKKRFGEKLPIIYDIKARNFQLPALTLQPIVENAVRHGVTKRDQGGTVTIETRENDSFVITVTDDGVGFDVNGKLENDGRSHVGIENTMQRLAAICGGTLKIESKPGEGTTAVITIPKGEPKL